MEVVCPLSIDFVATSETTTLLKMCVYIISVLERLEVYDDDSVLLIDRCYRSACLDASWGFDRCRLS